MRWDDYAHHLSDAETLALCRRIRTVEDAEAEALFPDNMSAVARIDTPRGRYQKRVNVPKGEPANFMTDAELRAKFDSLVAPYLNEQQRDGLAAALLSLDTAQDVAALLALTRPTHGAGLKAAAQG